MTTPTQKLDALVSDLAAAGITTAAEYAVLLNEERDDPTFRLIEDSDYWSNLGIHTARELVVSLDMSSFSDCYKEENGFRPRGWEYDDAMRWMDRHFGAE